jgi:hypothetical protein
MKLGLQINKSLFKKSEVMENVRFLQEIYEFFQDPENPGKINVYKNHNKLKELDGFPKRLDLENCEIKGVEANKIWFSACGDWQDPVNFAITLKNGKLVITGTYEADGNVPGQDHERIKEWKKNVELAGSLKKSFGGSTLDWDSIEKAFSHKYIRRWMGKNGKWQYLYPNDLLKPIAALKRLFGLEEKKVNDDYDKNNIKKEYGADKKTFAAHVIEYLSNRLKWDNIFRVKENREKYEKPVKQKDVAAAVAVEKINDDGGPSLFKEKAPPKAGIINRSLMRKVWGIYNSQKELDGSEESADNKDKEAENGKDSIGTGSGKLSEGTGEVRTGGSEEPGNQSVPGAGDTHDQGESGIGAAESGKRSLGQRGRSSIKAIREQVKKLLAEKSDSEMTGEDKELLRQYEGAGGLAEADSSVHGTLYEFYTPQKVVDKVWSLVDKYNPRTDKTVIEPSAGTGRFAEGRQEKFNLFELDETSARIAGILHPDAEIKQGYFQELFMNGRTPKKVYDGPKYDVAIGNPPYGPYSGFHLGLGEGKGHTRIEEYFIDRSLDTLKDGGVLAMVVPSSFLRGKNSKAKAGIAKKAKILEAWRLPNGTFGTTGIGTDIIILRKEPGDVMDFQNDIYFQNNEDHIAGDETERQGKFGMEKYVAPPMGMSFDDALGMIDPGKVPNLPSGEKSPEQEAIENIEVKSDAEEHENRSEAMMDNDNAAGSRGGATEDPPKTRRKKREDVFIPSIGKNMTADEFNKKYGKNINPKDYPIWKVTDYDGKIDVSRLSKSEKDWMAKSGNFAVDGEGNWYSIGNYASGNIYAKLEELEAQREKLGEKNYEFNKSLLEAVKPQPKTADQFSVSPISDFAKEYTIDDDEGNEYNLRDAFMKWIGMRTYGYGRHTRQDVDMDESPISQYEIPPHITIHDVIAYIRQDPVRADKATAKETDAATARLEAETKRIERRECAERLFNRFIREGLPEAERKNLEESWNIRYNSYVNPDYKKIPVFIEGMNTHKGKKEFNLLDRQVEGISFLCNKGNGILVHEVGLGKTVQAQVATVNQIQTGRAQRPLVCVPKAVYRKWINEFHQHFPDVVINELGNFSEKNISGFKTEGGGLNIQEGSISVCTYESLSKITFKDETIDGDLADDMADSQTIYDAQTDDKRSDRQRKQEHENIMKILGKGSKAEEGAIYWENTGFDHITVDEIHNFKNVFGEARVFTQSTKKAESDRGNANEFGKLASITPSDRAVKLFAITQLVQKQNDGRNVFGLSATPFNNSPIEVYNILSLVARQKLKDLHIYNMHEFLAQYAELTDEWSVDAKGDIITKSVMKKFNNLGSLQRLITEYMDYVSADEAGTIRPLRRPHIPKMELTPMQRAIINAETDRMTNADPKEDPGAYLSAINNMRLAALSPAAIDPVNYARYRGWEGWPDDEKDEPQSADFVPSSPKMKFVCDSVAQSWKEKPDAGQIIYLPRGVNDYIHVRDYLVAQGMPADSIEFMHSKTTLDEKERIKNDFNDPNGKTKVIIGSETIKEGVSLNGNTTALYNCMLGWNPTETVQVEGRAWRQGNEQGHVHIVYPLMNDSIDSFMYQKFEEKASRINDIWSLRGQDSIDVSDINPADLKFDLIKDPKKRAKFEIDLKKEEIKNNQRVEEARYEVLFKDRQLLEDNSKRLPGYKRDMDIAEAELAEIRKTRDDVQKKLEKLKKDKAPASNINNTEILLNDVKWRLERANSEFRNERRAYKEVKDIVDAVTAKFQKQGIKPEKMETVLKDIAAHIVDLKKQVEKLDSQFDSYVREAQKKLEAAKVNLPPLATQIKDHVRSIMDDLRPMDDLKKEIEAKRAAGLKKSLVIWKNRLYLKVS